MLRALNQVSGVFLSVRCCIRFGGDKRWETDLFHAPEKEGGARDGGWQGLNTKSSPLPPPSLRHAPRPSPTWTTGRLQRSATPRQQRLGCF